LFAASDAPTGAAMPVTVSETVMRATPLRLF
jgi:hypothetical protein